MTEMRQEGLTTEQLAGVQPPQPQSEPEPERRPESQSEPRPEPQSEQRTEEAELLDSGDRTAMTNRWRDIQADFVDHPRQAMQDADALVAGLMQQLAKTFADERAQLEAQWSRGDDVSTEDLRVSLQRYRAFFERLLAV